MCGIFGIVDFDRPPDAEALAAGVRTLRHRGPDDQAMELRPPAALGFHRLGIIDLVGSRQPMSNETDRVWMVFNGEIYNYRDLRTSLLARGHRFKTTGDGETILHLYEEHGTDFVDHLNGMFAIALWDEDQRRLVLARDRLGIKPLYYSAEGSRLAFASETKAILAAGIGGGDIDRDALAAYMNYSAIPGRHTCFRGISRLLPGEMAVFDVHGLARRTYWDVSFEQKLHRPVEDLEDEVESLLRDSVRMQMVADVPVGVFLSGGVDSSLVAAMMSVESRQRPVRAYAIGYGGEGDFLDETTYAEKVATRYGMSFEKVFVDAGGLLDDIETVAWHLDEPCGDPAAFLTLALSRFARRSITVALSGVGGDELFAGYRRYLGIAWQSRYRRLPRFFRDLVLRPLVETLPEGRTSRWGNTGRMAKKFVRSIGDDVKTTWARTVSYLPDYRGPIMTGDLADVRRETYNAAWFEEVWDKARVISDPVDRVTYVDLKMYLVDQLLLLQDKMTMAASIEARVPFLDHRLVELAAAIPVSMKMEGGELKGMLKRLAVRHAPRDCVYRSKKGFGAPVEAWLRGPLRDQVHEALSPSRIRERGVFEVGFIEWLKREFFERGRDLSLPVYQAYMLEVWWRMFVEAPRANGARAHAPRPAGAA